MLIDPVNTYSRRTPAALACVDLATHRRWNYREFDLQINKVAKWLIAELGPASAHRVVTIARNSADILILNLACVRAGAIFVPCNWRLSQSEIKAILDDAKPALIFCDAEFYLKDYPAKVELLSELAVMTMHSSIAIPLSARRTLHDTSTLLYTSGTSGRPKGVMLSEISAMASGFAFNTGNHAHSGSVFLCDMPLFHTAGLLANARGPLLFGGTVLISPGFNADRTLAYLSDSQYGITHYFSVPQMASMLWNHPDFDAEKLQNLKVYATGGAPNSKSQIERFINAGIPMSDGFGMTEAGSVSGMPVGNPDLIVKKAGSCGTPYLCMETMIVDGYGKAMPFDEPGELWVRGPGIALGYWNQPDKTEESFCSGWLKTGDIARIDEDGFLFLVDRKKDMYISGGENVYPGEIEAIIAELPGVDRVAVIGIADEKWGEKGVAFVVPAGESHLSHEQIETHCREKLAGFKIPKDIIFVKSLPQTSTGKIQKQQLREEWESIVTPPRTHL